VDCKKLYYFERRVSKSDSLEIFSDLVNRGHQRFYGTDIPGEPGVALFRICIPEILLYGLPNNIKLDPPYFVYDQEYDCNVEFDLAFRRTIEVDPRFIFLTKISTIMWDPDLKKFVSRPLIDNYYCHKSEKQKICEILIHLGFPHTFFMEYPVSYVPPDFEDYIFEKTSDIWK
jgi:hypothetical protein